MRSVPGRLVTGQLGQVREHSEQPDLGGQRAAGLAKLGPRSEVAGERAALVARVDVEPEQQAAQVLDSALGAADGRRGGGLGGQFDLDRLDGIGGLRLVIFRGQRLESQQRGAGLHLTANGDRQRSHPGAERRAQYRLHLHALQHEDRRTRLHLVADSDQRGDHQRGRGRADNPALVAAHVVRDAVDLHQVDRSVGAGDQAVALAVHGDLTAVAVEALDLDVGQVYAATADADADAEAPVPDAGHADPVAHAAELEVQRTSAIVLHLRPAAARRGE